MNAANAPLHVTALETQRRAHEPSMEEILASIRKIIADDDALPLSRSASEARVAPATPRPFETNVTPMAAPAPERAPEPSHAAEPAPAPEPASEPHHAPTSVAPVAPPAPPAAAVVEDFAQEAVAEPQVAAAAPPPALDEADLASFAEIASELAADDAQAPEPEAAPAHVEPARAPDLRPSLVSAVEFGRISAFDQTSDRPPQAQDHAPAQNLAPQAYEPDLGAMLSAEANASISSAFQALSASVQMTSSETIERHVRELLRPMLKQWLDDNLPVMVERMVRAEIERVARGGR